MNTQLSFVGQKLPDLDLTSTQSPLKVTHLKDFLGKHLVLYFYPKDDTPGCTLESNEFAELYPQFVALGAEILGISRDSIQSHDQFKCKYSLPFELISDADEKLCHHFDVLKEKNNYGKKIIGIERSTFLVDPFGVIQNEWRKVKAPGHAGVVLEALKKFLQTT